MSDMAACSARIEILFWATDRNPPSTAAIMVAPSAGLISTTDLQEFKKGNPQWRDIMWTRAASHIVKQHRPNLLFFQLLNLDGTHHKYGQKTPAAMSAISLADARVAELLAAVEEAGMKDRTTVFVVADHGFKTVHIPDQPATSGHHRLDGILAMVGRGVPRGGHIEGARLVDVLPTILTLFDLPMARTLEGTVPRVALDPAFAAVHGRRQVADYSGTLPAPAEDASDVDANVLERLRSLGYIR